VSQDLTQPRQENSRLIAELAQAKSELQRLNFTVQHDLRAPLRHISAFVKVIEEDHSPELGAQVLAHLKVIDAAATTATKILDTLAGSGKP
jgi:light-regulated signal transduction histidine kinase (bacteriophytochrome)